MPYPLASLAPTITAAGISAPTYNEIYQSLIASFRLIYGDDIYLAPDSQDGQLITLFAKAIDDSNQATITMWNSFRPTAAQGAGLSSLVKINGMTRRGATYSTAVGTVTGTPSTLIINGVVRDTSQRLWDLPASVLIPAGGSIEVTVTAQESGPISAAAGSINLINNPQVGWDSFVSTADALIGKDVETDAELRVRQAQSTSLPSQSIFEGIVGAVWDTDLVTRVAGYENDTNATDSNGIPAKSIAMVVEGGADAAIALTIAKKKTPGTGTYGSTAVVVTDINGYDTTINFERPSAQAVHVALTIQGLAGYSNTILPDIKQALVDFINALGIGKNVLYYDLLVPAKLNNSAAGLTYRITAMTIAKGAGAHGVVDLAMAFNEVAVGTEGNIVITVV